MDIPTDTKPSQIPGKTTPNPNLPGNAEKYLANPEIRSKLVKCVTQNPEFLAKIENPELKALIIRENEKTAPRDLSKAGSTATIEFDGKHLTLGFKPYGYRPKNSGKPAYEPSVGKEDRGYDYFELPAGTPNGIRLDREGAERLLDTILHFPNRGTLAHGPDTFGVGSDTGNQRHQVAFNDTNGNLCTISNHQDIDLGRPILVIGPVIAPPAEGDNHMQAYYDKDKINELIYLLEEKLGS